jgi:hypothetical protein
MTAKTAKRKMRTTPRSQLPKIPWKKLKKVYEVLGQSVDDPTSPGNVAERHNEHQP